MLQGRAVLIFVGGLFCACVCATKQGCTHTVFVTWTVLVLQGKAVPIVFFLLCEVLLWCIADSICILEQNILYQQVLLEP